MKIRDIIPFHRSKNIPVEHTGDLQYLQPFENRSVDNFFSGFNEIANRLFTDFEGLSQFDSKILSPNINISETAKNIVVEAEIPGVDEHDLHITVDRDSLTIKGEKRSENKSEQDKVHRVECSYGAFERVIQLPDYAKSDGIKANYKKGVLNITIPKDTQKTKWKKIPIAVD